MDRANEPMSYSVVNIETKEISIVISHYQKTVRLLRRLPLWLWVYVMMAFCSILFLTLLVINIGSSQGNLIPILNAINYLSICRNPDSND